MLKMNIFFLSMSIKRCARYHFDKHVVKMILEYCQLLSTAWHILAPDEAKIHHTDNKIYRPTHKNHPCTIWVRQHINNYLYVCRLGLELCEEWRYRYQHTREHKSEPKLLFLLNNIPPIPSYNIIKNKHNPKSLKLPLPQAMPPEYKRTRNTVHTSVKAYRKYYQSPEKEHIVSWTKKRDGTKVQLTKPPWFK